MKNWKKIVTTICTAALLIVLSAASVLAAEKESYTYTVTFYAGVQGDFAGTAGLSVDNPNAVVTQSADQIKVSGLAAGDTVSFNAQAGVSLGEDSKYYVQGVRLSGRDNDTVAASVFAVEEDADYVVAYGIKGNMTSYVVNYQNANGTELAPSQTFYGNVGDKPVVAYQYIEGYAPNAFGLTKTLSENAAENVFTFVYEPVPTQTVQTVVQPSNPDGTTPDGNNAGPGGTTPDGDNAGPGGTTPDGNNAGPDGETPDGDNAGPGGETPDGTEEGPGAEPEAEDVPTSESPEIVDLDEEEVPLTDAADKADEVKKSLPIAGFAAIAVVALCGLGYMSILIRRRRR